MATDPPHQGAAGRTSPIRPTYTLLLGALCRVAQALAPSLQLPVGVGVLVSGPTQQACLAAIQQGVQQAFAGVTGVLWF